jgi:CheY-like chemotaxis protein
MIEPAARPLAPDAVIAALAAQVAAGTRVVTVGADFDALLSLRQALSRQGLSVSMAWDAKQAAELVEMVRPSIVVADLGMQRDACAFVASLTGASPMPTVVLIEGTGDTAASFAAALGDPALTARLTPLGSLMSVLFTSGGGTRGRGPS